jgi:hypothetical protein
MVVNGNLCEERRRRRLGGGAVCCAQDQRQRHEAQAHARRRRFLKKENGVNAPSISWNSATPWQGAGCQRDPVHGCQIGTNCPALLGVWGDARLHSTSPLLPEMAKKVPDEAIL